MTTDTRADLITEICDYLSNDDLATRAPALIQKAEAMFNRRLFVLNGEDMITATAAASVAVPADFNGVCSVKLDDYGPLASLGADDFQERFAEDANTGVPEFYMLAGSTIYLGPPPDAAYTITLHYWKKLAALTETNPVNWLLTAHPDLYLYASLLQAELFGWNDERLPTFKAAVDLTIREIISADARIRRADLVGSVPASYF